ncbi:LemA family protein [Candidatus Gracilibacteria bacterium CG18_big_fil_WC_8_21_14_2_50_38_16]|nr:MAG: LemA family protein [Candidatus Gracilibacteria bacterium CG18_big_fil_WC_8_21_14_2_50_38_16]
MESNDLFLKKQPISSSSISMAKWIFPALIFILFIWAYTSYNGIISMDENIKSLDSQIGNMYSRQAELLPQMTAIVKAAAKYESSTLEGVTALRGASQNLQKLEEFQKSGSISSTQFSALLATTMSSMKIMGEAYPQLQANQNYMSLMSSVEGNVNRITVATKDYNDAVAGYNAQIRSFPFGILFSKWFGFTPKDRTFNESEKLQKVDTKGASGKVDMEKALEIEK